MRDTPKEYIYTEGTAAPFVFIKSIYFLLQQSLQHHQLMLQQPLQQHELVLQQPMQHN